MIQIKNRFLILIAIMCFNNVISMDAPRDEVVAAEGDGMIIMGDNHYEDPDNLLDANRTKMTELLKVIEKNKTEIIGRSMLGVIFGGGLFHQLLIPRILEDKSNVFFKWIKENPIKSTAFVATGSGALAALCTISSHAGQRGEKREQLQNIKDLEKNKDEIINNPLLNDVIRGIRIDNIEELLNKAITKYKGN